MSSQYAGTVNQNKEDNSIHQKNLTKLCRVCCSMVGKKKYDVKRYTDSIENNFYININIDGISLDPEYMCQKCYSLVTSSMKRKTTIKLTPFSECDPHSTNCQIYNKVKLLQKWIIGTQKLKTQKIPLGKTKANTNICTQSALENLKETTQPDLLPNKLTLKYFAPDINPHLHLCVCGISENLRKPLITKSCQHVFCFLCLSSFLKSKPEDPTFCPTCSKQFSINDVSHSTHTNDIINIPMLSCKTCNTKYCTITEYNLYLIHQKECSLSTAEQSQSMSVTDIFDLPEKCKITRLVQGAELHVIRTKMSMSSLPNNSIEFKTDGPRVRYILIKIIKNPTTYYF